jgi:hypothetical protein
MPIVTYTNVVGYSKQANAQNSSVLDRSSVFKSTDMNDANKIDTSVNLQYLDPLALNLSGLQSDYYNYNSNANAGQSGSGSIGQYSNYLYPAGSGLDGSYIEPTTTNTPTTTTTQPVKNESIFNSKYFIMFIGFCLCIILVFVIYLIK